MSLRGSEQQHRESKQDVHTNSVNGVNIRDVNSTNITQSDGKTKETGFPLNKSSKNWDKLRIKSMKSQNNNRDDTQRMTKCEERVVLKNSKVFTRTLSDIQGVSSSKKPNVTQLLSIINSGHELSRKQCDTNTRLSLNADRTGSQSVPDTRGQSSKGSEWKLLKGKLALLRKRSNKDETDITGNDDTVKELNINADKQTDKSMASQLDQKSIDTTFSESKLNKKSSPVKGIVCKKVDLMHILSEASKGINNTVKIKTIVNDIEEEESVDTLCAADAIQSDVTSGASTSYVLNSEQKASTSSSSSYCQCLRHETKETTTNTKAGTECHECCERENCSKNRYIPNIILTNSNSTNSCDISVKSNSNDMFVQNDCAIELKTEPNSKCKVKMRGKIAFNETNLVNTRDITTDDNISGFNESNDTNACSAQAVQWDDINLDPLLLGDAIQAFLQGLGSNTTANVSTNEKRKSIFLLALFHICHHLSVVLTREPNVANDQRNLDQLIDLLEQQDRYIHRGIASGRLDAMDKSDSDDDDIFGKVLLQDLKSMEDEIKIPEEDYSDAPYPPGYPPGEGPEEGPEEGSERGPEGGSERGHEISSDNDPQVNEINERQDTAPEDENQSEILRNNDEYTTISPEDYEETNESPPHLVNQMQQTMSNEEPIRRRKKFRPNSIQDSIRDITNNFDSQRVMSTPKPTNEIIYKDDINDSLKGQLLFDDTTDNDNDFPAKVFSSDNNSHKNNNKFLEKDFSQRQPNYKLNNNKSYDTFNSPENPIQRKKELNDKNNILVNDDENYDPFGDKYMINQYKDQFPNSVQNIKQMTKSLDQNYEKLEPKDKSIKTTHNSNDSDNQSYLLNNRHYDKNIEEKYDKPIDKQNRHPNKGFSGPNDHILSHEDNHPYNGNNGVDGNDYDNENADQQQNNNSPDYHSLYNMDNINDKTNKDYKSNNNEQQLRPDIHDSQSPPPGYHRPPVEESIPSDDIIQEDPEIEKIHNKNEIQTNPTDFHQTKPEIGSGDKIMKYYEDQSKVDSRRLASHAIQEGLQNHNKTKRDTKSVEFSDITNETLVTDENKQIDRLMTLNDDLEAEECKKKTKKVKQLPKTYRQRPNSGSREFQQIQEYHSNTPMNDDDPTPDDHISDEPIFNSGLTSNEPKSDEWATNQRKIAEDEFKRKVEEQRIAERSPCDQISDNMHSPNSKSNSDHQKGRKSSGQSAKDISNSFIHQNNDNNKHHTSTYNNNNGNNYYRSQLQSKNNMKTNNKMNNGNEYMRPDSKSPDIYDSPPPQQSPLPNKPCDQKQSSLNNNNEDYNESDYYNNGNNNDNNADPHNEQLDNIRPYHGRRQTNYKKPDESPQELNYETDSESNDGMDSDSEQQPPPQSSSDTEDHNYNGYDYYNQNSPLDKPNNESNEDHPYYHLNSDLRPQNDANVGHDYSYSINHSGGDSNQMDKPMSRHEHDFPRKQSIETQQAKGYLGTLSQLPNNFESLIASDQSFLDSLNPSIYNKTSSSGPSSEPIDDDYDYYHTKDKSETDSHTKTPHQSSAPSADTPYDEPEYESRKQTPPSYDSHSDNDNNDYPQSDTYSPNNSNSLPNHSPTDLHNDDYDMDSIHGNHINPNQFSHQSQGSRDDESMRKMLTNMDTMRFIENLIKSLPTNPNQKQNNTENQEINEESFVNSLRGSCSSHILTILPLRAKNIGGQWKVITQLNGFVEQRVNLTKCSDQKECEPIARQFSSKYMLLLLGLNIFKVANQLINGSTDDNLSPLFDTNLVPKSQLENYNDFDDSEYMDINDDFEKTNEESNEDMTDKDYKEDETPDCASDHSFCFYDHNYPEKQIRSSIDRQMDILTQILPESAETFDLVDGIPKEVDENFIYSDEDNNLQNDDNSDQSLSSTDNLQQTTAGYICPSYVSYIQPMRALNNDGFWRVILNLNDSYRGIDIKQHIRIEECMYESSECHTSVNNYYKSSCIQKYSNERLLVWTADRGIHLDVFRLPIACSCHLTPIGN
ncbi:putative uncharacterized protein DDB_G0282133 [Oppia nitens]|uniref:putative uncharacterized protein DDB_G0282133 n=1 Tax=Oppia nitens TaxID=1686743 RepID=UPI0023DABEA4|nr:putative uncharacterized protein DDB_G0282133 [Oppia nitens]